MPQIKNFCQVKPLLHRSIKNESLILKLEDILSHLNNSKSRERTFKNARFKNSHWDKNAKTSLKSAGQNVRCKVSMRVFLKELIYLMTQITYGPLTKCRILLTIKSREIFLEGNAEITPFGLVNFFLCGSV